MKKIVLSLMGIKMEINKSQVWVQLGYDDIYVRYPGESTWLVLSQDDAPWAARVSVFGGCEFLRQAGQKLGLNDSDIDKLVLNQLIESVGENPVLFAPPRQLNGLQRAAEDLASPPYAITLDSRFLVNQKTISIQQRKRDTDVYLFDWNNINQGFIRQFVDKQEIFDGCPFPVLMTAKAYAEGRAEILSYYQGESGLGASTVILEAPHQFHQGAQTVGMGLVWAWGFGARMWQWALKPRALPSGKKWIFECVPPNICRVRVEQGDEQVEWTLSTPVMDVCFDSDGYNNK